MNEWTTLKDKEVLEFLNQNNITLMKINWDPDNIDISQIFEKHQRAGIPFYSFLPLWRSTGNYSSGNPDSSNSNRHFTK